MHLGQRPRQALEAAHGTSPAWCLLAASDAPALQIPGSRLAARPQRATVDLHEPRWESGWPSEQQRERSDRALHPPPPTMLQPNLQEPLRQRCPIWTKKPNPHRSLTRGRSTHRDRSCSLRQGFQSDNSGNAHRKAKALRKSRSGRRGRRAYSRGGCIQKWQTPNGVYTQVSVMVADQ